MADDHPVLDHIAGEGEPAALTIFSTCERKNRWGCDRGQPVRQAVGGHHRKRKAADVDPIVVRFTIE
ncbi:MAG TPA: hypothetical protein VFR64_16540 [Methylomirabilota bacterium]|nr:hypothetical protein [Methylomirabilota bacterium]